MEDPSLPHVEPAAAGAHPECAEAVRSAEALTVRVGRTDPQRG